MLRCAVINIFNEHIPKCIDNNQCSMVYIDGNAAINVVMRFIDNLLLLNLVFLFFFGNSFGSPEKDYFNAKKIV
jgi:hypothetical protein